MRIAVPFDKGLLPFKIVPTGFMGVYIKDTPDSSANMQKHGYLLSFQGI